MYVIVNKMLMRLTECFNLKLTDYSTSLSALLSHLNNAAKLRLTKAARNTTHYYRQSSTI